MLLYANAESSCFQQHCTASHLRFRAVWGTGFYTLLPFYSQNDKPKRKEIFFFQMPLHHKMHKMGYYGLCTTSLNCMCNIEGIGGCWLVMYSEHFVDQCKISADIEKWLAVSPRSGWIHLEVEPLPVYCHGLHLFYMYILCLSWSWCKPIPQLKAQTKYLCNVQYAYSRRKQIYKACRPCTFLWPTSFERSSRWNGTRLENMSKLHRPLEDSQKNATVLQVYICIFLPHVSDSFLHMFAAF